MGGLGEKRGGNAIFISLCIFIGKTLHIESNQIKLNQIKSNQIKSNQLNSTQLNSTQLR